MLPGEENMTFLEGRQKRFNAGNRMTALLQAAKASTLVTEEGFEELDNDAEFVNKAEEEDKFESDFASTADEAEDDEQAAARIEREIARAERKAKKKAKRTGTNFSYLKHASAPKLQPLKSSLIVASTLDSTNDNACAELPRKKPRTSSITPLQIQDVIDVDAISSDDEIQVIGIAEQRRRQSDRRIVKASQKALIEKLEERKSRKLGPRGPKPKQRPLTQAELIAEALEEEDRNSEKLKDWVKKEEERRRSNKMVRKKIEGPVLTWISREASTRMIIPIGEETEKVDPLVEEAEGEFVLNWGTNMGRIKKPNIVGESGDEDVVMESQPTTATSSGFDAPDPLNDVISHRTTASNQLATWTSTAVTLSAPVPSQSNLSTRSLSPPKRSRFKQPLAFPTSFKMAGNSDARPQAQPQAHPADQGRHSQSFLVLNNLKSSYWAGEYKVLFGDHVQWDKMKVIQPRNRPSVKNKQTCPITGLPALYMHPQAQIPFANVQAYKAITALMSNGHKWSDTLGAYVRTPNSAASQPIISSFPSPTLSPSSKSIGKPSSKSLANPVSQPSPPRLLSAKAQGKQPQRDPPQPLSISSLSDSDSSDGIQEVSPPPKLVVSAATSKKRLVVDVASSSDSDDSGSSTSLGSGERDHSASSSSTRSGSSGQEIQMFARRGRGKPRLSRR